MKNEDVEKCTILLCVAGSKAYGTDTPESDTDVRGICLPLNPTYYVGMGINNFEQQEKGWSDDRVVYDLRKALNLMADNNPNMMDMLFADDINVMLQKSPWLEVLRYRSKFLSKKVRHTYGGYAFAQLKRIQRHRSYLLNPPKKKPERKDYGLPDQTLVSKDYMGAVQWLLANFLKGSIEEMNFSDATREELAKVNFVGLVQSNMTDQVSDDAWKIIQKVSGTNDHVMEIIAKEKAYSNALCGWNAYKSWESDRNEKRKILEAKYGYDCYHKETEFLTEMGWKKYDEIKDEKLATVNKDNVLEFQTYTKRIKKPFIGKMVEINTQDTKCLITPTHRLLLSPMSRRKNNNFSSKYEESKSSWTLKTFDKILLDRKSHYHIRSTIENNNPDTEVTDDYLRLLGLYVSEGSLLKRRNKNNAITLKGVSISQLKTGKACKILKEIRQYPYVCHEHNRKNRIECSFNFYDKSLAEKLKKDGNEYSKNKTLPDWIVNLSKRQSRILLESLMSGDGTYKKESCIYYTISLDLANKVQMLGLLCGYNTKLWDYQKNHGIYQVYIKIKANKTNHFITKGKQKSYKEFYYEDDVVCFSVPNETLITRFAGEIAIQGNCKHGMHLVRLMRMGMEILETGKVNVYRQDREELKAIRNGAWSYEKVVEYAEKCEKRLDELYKVTTLPSSSDRVFIDRLCQDIIAEHVFRGTPL